MLVALAAGGAAYFHASDTSVVEAEADATTCISIAPDFARSYCRLSKCKEKQGYLGYKRNGFFYCKRCC